MPDALYTALVGVLIALLGWFAEWLKGRAKGKVIDAVVTGVEQIDAKEVKEAIDRLAKSKGIKELLDKILAKKGFLFLLLVPLLVLSAGCGLLSSGTTGAAGELGNTIATGNFYVFNLAGPATVTVDEDGNVVAKSTANGGDVTTTGAGVILNVGREAISATTSSGGGGTGANQEGGSGDVSPSLPSIPGVIP